LKKLVPASERRLRKKLATDWSASVSLANVAAGGVESFDFIKSDFNGSVRAFALKQAGRLRSSPLRAIKLETG
jgi:hypothetical protein